MQSVSSRIWTRVAVSISYDDNHYSTGTTSLLYEWSKWTLLFGLLKGVTINLREKCYMWIKTIQRKKKLSNFFNTLVNQMFCNISVMWITMRRQQTHSLRLWKWWTKLGCQMSSLLLAGFSLVAWRARPRNARFQTYLTLPDFQGFCKLSKISSTLWLL